VTWTASTDNDRVTHYTVALGLGLPLPTQATSFTYRGLKADTDYEFRIKAYDAAGNSSSPAKISFRTAKT
jgi:chitodextrinase